MDRSGASADPYKVVRVDIETASEREGRPHLLSLRMLVRDRVEASPRLRRFYVSLCGWRARREAGRGRRFTALRHLLHGQKHARPGEPGGGPGRARVESLLADACYAGGKLLPVARNGLLQEWRSSPEAGRVRRTYARIPRADRLRMRWPRDDHDPERQGNLLVLKSPAPGEPGVLLLKYNPAILDFAALFDLPRLAARYTLVLEPSFWGYRHHRFFPYLGSDLRVVVQCHYPPDFDFIAGLNTNLVPVRLGPSDWADSRAFRCGPGPRRFDVAMVAAWSPWKRHVALFRAMRALRRRGRRLKAALVGYPWDWKRAKVERIARSHGVADDCTFFESIPHAEVARLLADSKVSLFLSGDEGSPKALLESMLCGAAPIVFSGNRGIDLDRIREPVGRLAGDDDLPDVICDVVDRHAEFDPRSWALEHTGFENATRILNETLEGLSPRWSRDIAPKKNAPHLRYAEPGRYRDFARDYDDLAEFLIETEPPRS